MSRLSRMYCVLPATALLLIFGCGSPTNESQSKEPAAEAENTAVTNEVSAADPVSAASVYFITPADGDVVSNPVSVEFGIAGMAVVPAGQDTPHSGHHHLLIDAPLPDLSLPVPKNDHYVHFGDGSASTELTLEPGEHTLQLLFADFLHIPHDPVVKSATITITVE